jgi:hypothetical protein
LQKIFTNLALKAAPPALALLCVLKGTALTNWANRHEATLLIILFALVGSLVHPQLRHLVITSLCYGVAFLAARDMFFPLGLPPGLRNGFYQHLRMAALCTVSILTLSAAIAESFSPGAVWARRCYFGGAALYFLGTGVLNYRMVQSWQSIMMVITGLASFAGSAFAHKIVEIEKEDELEAPSNEQTPTESTHVAHVQEILAKEWHDPLDRVDHQAR